MGMSTEVKLDLAAGVLAAFGRCGDPLEVRGGAGAIHNVVRDRLIHKSHTCTST